MTQHNGNENLQTVEAFFSALERHDKDALVPLLAPEVVETIPFSSSGAPEPFSEFRGKEAVLGYLGQIIDNFARTVLVDKRFYVSDDGSAVFVEAKGDLVQAGTSAPYRNVYIFKFVFDEGGKVVHISEYANPVTFAKLVGMPLG